MLGFDLDFWDYVTFIVLMLSFLSFTIVLLTLAGLPGRIAIRRKHPEAQAVKLMGWAGFFTLLPWIQAFIWAFKPTTVVDIRRYPAEEAVKVDEEISNLTGKADTKEDISSSSPTSENAPLNPEEL